MTRLRGLREKLNQMRMPELRNVLVDLNLARSGRKMELVDRIAVALEAFEAKAAENSANHATVAYYTDQLNAALRNIDAQIRASRPQMHAGALPSAHTPPAHGAASLPHLPYPMPFPSPVPTHRNIPGYHSTVTYAQPSHHQRPVMSLGASPPPSSRVVTSSGTIRPPGRPIGPDGSTVLHPNPSADASSARCFCQGEAPVSGIVKCAQCRRGFHAKCHQIPATAAEWYCESCRADIYDPFYVVKKRVVPGITVQFQRTPSVFRFSYSVNDKDINDLYARRDAKVGAMSPGSLELQLRCFSLKDDLANGTCWPASTQLSVNGFNVQIMQRAPPGQANPSKVLRELPANLFPFTRVGSNKVEIRTNDNPSAFVFMVHMVEVRDINDLIREVQLASESITYEQAVQDVIKSFGDEDEDDVVALSTILSVRCPLGLCVINLPARGVHCKHLQCFDLRTFLQFSKKARSKAYRCAVCHNFIKATDLRIDPYLKKLLADVEHEEELEEVEILPDATWRRRITEDTSAPPALKRVKTEQVETATAGVGGNDGNASSGGSATAATPAETASSVHEPGSSAAPVEIDLSLSSDEEDDDGAASAQVPTSIPASALRTMATATAVPVNRVPPAPAAPPAGAATAGTAAAGNGAPGLLGDDVAVLTVDSDVWDTNRSTTNGEMRLANALGVSTMANGGGVNGDMFQFPLDDSIFASLAPSAGTNGGSAANWNPMYGGGYMGSAVPTNGQTYPSSNNSGSWDTGSSSTGSGLMQQPEVDLASTMAMLSQDTPPQPDRRPAATRPEIDPLDIICLLDSDSD